MKNQDNHHWTKEDYKVLFFVVRYGHNPIYFKNENEVIDFIGTTDGSFKKMCSNFKHLLGIPNNLSHIKTLQQEVFDEYKSKPFMEFCKECREIVEGDTYSKILLQKGITNYRKLQTV